MKKVLVKKSVPITSTKPPGSGLLGFVPAHPPLLLSGLPSTVTQQQVFSAVEKFGKSRLISVVQQEVPGTTTVRSRRLHPATRRLFSAKRHPCLAAQQPCLAAQQRPATR
ncbi:unnamed protein product [Arctogadus glacialis]